MLLLGVFLAVVALCGVLGIWVLAARPRSTANRALGLLLLLVAGSTVAFYRYRNAGTPGEALRFIRWVTWYELLIPLLTLILVDELFFEAPRSRVRKAVLGGVGAATALALVGHGLSPAWFHTALEPLSEGNRLGVSRHAGAEALGVATIGAQLVAVLAGGYVAGDDDRPLIERRQAALVALAFAFLLAHGPVQTLSSIAVHASLLGSVGLARIAGLAAVAWAWPRIGRPFDGGSRRVILLAPLLPLLGGAWDASAIPFPPESLDLLGANTRPLWLAWFGVTIALAVVRYGLSGVTQAGWKRLARATGAILLLSAAGSFAAVALLALGVTPTGLVASVAVAGAIAALPLTPLRQVPGRVLDYLLLDPGDPDVVRARVDAYERAVQDAGDPASSQMPRLEALRRELGFTERDHALLVSAQEPASDATVFLGRYFVEEPLTTSHDGSTYVARDSVLGRPVVVKHVPVHGTNGQAALAEARALGRVDHPNVVDVYDARVEGNGLLLVLEHVDGGTLADVLHEEGLPLGRACQIVLDLLDALGAVHEEGLVHGDVKASNVLLTRDGEPKLADFGAVRYVEPAPDETLPAGPSRGTPATMAPEQATGDPVTPATDLYAVGALLYRLLAGETYLDLDETDLERVHDRILSRTPDLGHPDVPEPLVEVMERALAKDPTARFESASGMRQALEAAVAECEITDASSHGFEHEA